MSVLIYVAVPLFIISIWIEHALLKRQGHSSYERRDLWTSLGLGIGNVSLSALVKGSVLGLAFLIYEHRIFDLGQGVLAWVLLFFAEDLCYYAYHRTSHESRLFWAAHVNHHSSQHYHLGTALRQSWTTPFTSFWFWLPLPLLGFHPLMVMTQQAISLIYQFFIHTELVTRLGPLEWVLNTPSHHRVHHASNPRYLDSNHGGILIVWDRLFGSFAREDEQEPPVYGLTTNISRPGLVHAALHEWAALLRDAARARGLRNKLLYVFGPPGWSPDGSSLTARQMRQMRRTAGQRLAPE